MCNNSLRLAGASARKECDILRNRNILVKAYAEEHGIDFRTVSRNRKSPHRFYIPRDDLKELEHKAKIIVHDIYSFAILHLNTHTGMLEIEFDWLSGNSHNIMGWQETVILPYEEFAAFVHDSTLGGPSEWKALSINNPSKQPKLIFNSRKNLHAAIQNGIIRRKLARFLRDGFRWPNADQIELYDDFLPYSFTFQEIKNGKMAMNGGLILHQQDDIKKAYYGIHT